MSQKYYTRSRLEEIREDASFYFREWLENEFNPRKAKQYEIRYRFLMLKFYEIMSKDLEKADYRNAYENAKEKYEELFPSRDRFSMMHKA